MFGGGGGGFGTSSTGFGTSTPFGASGTGQQGSAFGGGGTAFGSGTTSAFGAKPTFGASTTTGGFGSTSAFGAKPSAFGAPAPATSNVFGAAPGTSAFGRTTSTSPFGAPAPAPAGGAFGSTTTGAFGAPAPSSSPFGAPAPAAGLGGFGSSAASSNPFGKPASSPFGAPAPAPGATGVFGAAPAPGATGFGGFGTPSGTTGGGLFGSTTPAPATGAFGAPAPSPAGGAFGGFGSSGGAFGTASTQQQGTGNPQWRQTRADDPSGKAGANPGMLMSISAMKEYSGKSHEELRVEDYLQNRKNSSAVNSSTTATGFGGITLGGAPAPAGGGLFGGFGAAPSPAPAAGSTFSFGGGAAAPTPSGFGLFGAPAPAPSTTGFGGFGTSPAPAPGGLFGAPAPSPTATTAFGSSTGGFSFGNTPAPAPSTSAFGFGSTAPQPAPAAGGGLFGASPAPAAGGFSFGATAGIPAPAPSAFGSTFGFGTTPAPAAPAPGAFSFGAPAAGAPAPSAFGAPAPAPGGGLFGGGGGGLFGSTPVPAPSIGGFSFGKAAATPAPGAGAFSFGSTTGGFGSGSKPASTFGAPAPATGGLFGSTPAPAPGAFGFGTSTAPAPAQSSGFSFGGFGAPAPASTPTFGAPAPSSGGLFGSTATGGFSFGGTQQQQQQQQQQRVAMHNQDPYGATGNPGFGSGALEQKIKGVENSSQQLAISFERSSGNTPSGIGAGDQGAGGSGGLAGSASVGNAPPSIGFAYRRTPRSSARIRPRGLAGGVEPSGGGGGGMNTTMPPPSSSRLLSEGSLTPSAAGKSGGILSPDVYLSGGVKRLIIPTSHTEERRPRFSESRPLIKSNTDDAAAGGHRALTENGERGRGGRVNGSSRNAGGGAEETKNGEASSSGRGSTTPNGALSSRSDGNDHVHGRSGARGRSGMPALSSPDGSTRLGHGVGEIASPPPSSGVGTDVRAAADGSGGDESLMEDSSPAGNGGGGALFHGDGDVGSSASAPKLDIEGYETRPSISELAAMDERSLRSVAGFKLSRPGYGSIEWTEPVDLRRLDIGKLVVIGFKSVSVYDELPEGEEKPSEGQGLNKPTRVTLVGVFPKGENVSYEKKRSYEKKVRDNTKRIGAEFVDYSADTGKWVFKTRHWSRYGMDDSDDEEDGGEADTAAQSASKLMPPPPPPGAAGRVTRASTAFRGGVVDTSVSTARGKKPSRRPTKYSMPDTDDEGSVADNASDTGGGAAAAADISIQARSSGENADMMDADDIAQASSHDADETKEVSLDEPRLRTNVLFKHAMDIEQVESMRVASDVERRSRGRGRGFDVRATPGGLPELLTGTAVANLPDESYVTEWSPWQRLSMPRPSTPPVLADPEDAKAAAAFRCLPAPQSRVLRLLGKAWERQEGEVKDEAARGAVRAGQAAADLGLRLGKGFRASWGPGGKLVCLGGKSNGDPSRHTVNVIQFDPTPAASGRGVDELYLEPLRNHLRFANAIGDFIDPREQVSGDHLPPRWALPQRVGGLAQNYEALVRCMHGYVAAHATTMMDGRSGRDDRESSPEWVLEQTWRLASAMWGQEDGEDTLKDLPMPGEELTCAERGEGTSSGSDGASPASRREATVADWLANAVDSCVPAVPAGNDQWRNILKLLSVRRIDDAAKLAMTSGLPRLAVVLGAAAAGAHGGGSWAGARFPSSALAKQVESWQKEGADARMPQEALAVYQLLGREGFRDVQLRGLISKAADTRHPSLDWLRQFGLCLWFGAGTSLHEQAGAGNIGVAEAVQAFESLVNAQEALPPIARYFSEPTHHNTSDLEEVCAELRRVHVQAGASGRDRCILNRLLALYPPRKDDSAATGDGSASFPGTALIAALEPLAVSPDVMDYRHSWHLMTVVEALGVAKISDRCTAAAVAEGLRFQLVAAGMWEWAVYVALSAEGSADRREATAHELVLRYGYGLFDTAEGSRGRRRLDLLCDLGVPSAWLWEAEAVRAGYEHKSALPAPTPSAMKHNMSASSEDGDLSTATIVTAELRREKKVSTLINCCAPRLGTDAAAELCRLVPISLYLGDNVRYLMTRFRSIAQLLDDRERDRSIVDGTTMGDSNSMLMDSEGFQCLYYGGRTEEFNLYKSVLEAAERMMEGNAATAEDVERLHRLRDSVEQTATKVAGQVVAHEAMSTLWREGGLAVGQ